jgi:hypothetical protein
MSEGHKYPLVDIKFTKILGQFKQKDICRFIHDMQFQVFLSFEFNFCKL